MAMPESIDSQSLDDYIRCAIISQIGYLFHEHQEKVELKHHLKKELETLHEPPEKRHSLQKYLYDEMMREVRERPEASQTSEDMTRTKEPESVYHENSITGSPAKGDQERIAAMRRLKQIKEDIKEIDERILIMREQKAEADNMLERSIYERQLALIDLDLQFLSQIMDEPSIGKLEETRDGLKERVYEIEQDIRVLMKRLFDQSSADEDTGTRSRAELP